MQRIVNKFYEGGQGSVHITLREWTLRRAEGHHAQGWSLCSDLERRRPLVQTEGRSVVSSIIRGWCGHLTINRTFGSSCHRGSLTCAQRCSASHLAFSLLLRTSGANRGTSLLQAALQLGFRQSRGSAKDASTVGQGFVTDWSEA